MTDQVPPKRHSKWLDGKFSWDPQRLVRPSSSKASPIATARGKQPTTMGEGGSSSESQPATGNDDTEGHRAASDFPHEARSGTRLPARRPALRRSKRIPPRTFPRPLRPRAPRIPLPAKERPSSKHIASSLRGPNNTSSQPVRRYALMALKVLLASRLLTQDL
ncbi:hypothetical protein BC826DRAFT_741690 [Russula brevipes]|nr:hypothetical protein BC826DRAFT_741690 [Russula brevipes]